MILKIAVRNLFRNKRRSLIVVSSVIAGVVSIILNNSFGNGVLNQMLVTQMSLHTSHIQIHKIGFNESRNLQSTIPDDSKVESVLRANKKIRHFSSRIFSFGLINSASSSSGAAIVGINTDREKEVTSISKLIVAGKYPKSGFRDVLIGKTMADKLEVNVGGKIVVVANSSDGNSKSELFRVSGIFKSGGSEFDNFHIYIPQEFADSLLELNGQHHEYALIANSLDDVSAIKKALSNELGSDYEVLTYKELLPLIVTYIEVYESTIIVFYIIIGMAVLFGIINSMLMSVFERVQEFGVLMAIGMKVQKIYAMVIIESLIIGIIGTFVGFVIGITIYAIVSNTGIDLRAFSESLNSVGINAIIYPELNFRIIINALIVMPITSVVGALYPAYKAIKLQPTDAMRYV